MRVAALSDVHGNLPALEAALAEVEREDPDLVVSCGDVVWGPLPSETLELLRALGDRVRWVRGNADRGVLASDDERIAWCRRQLSEEQQAFVAGFVDTLAVDVDGLGLVLFCHGSPRSDVEMMTSATPEERLAQYVAGVEADVVVCGHTHIQFDRVAGGVRVVNCGSVGMPYGEPGAHWALLGPDLDFRRTPYDREAAAERLRASGWPEAEEFVRENVLAVPTVEEAMSFFRSHGGP